MKDQENNSDQSKWGVNLNLSDIGMVDKIPKIDVNLEIEGSLPSKPARNLSPALTEEISRLRAEQEAQTGVIKDQGNNSDRSRWKADLTLSDIGRVDKIPKIDVNLEVEGSLPSKSARNPSPALIEEISRVRAEQEAQTAERQLESKRRKTTIPKSSGASPRRREASRKRKPGRGGHEFPRC